MLTSQEQTFTENSLILVKRRRHRIYCRRKLNRENFENNQKTLIIYYNNELIQILAKP